MASAWAVIGSVWLALVVDHWLGEPPARWHPVVWMGRYLGWLGQRISPTPAAARTPDWLSFAAGTLGWWSGAAFVFAGAWAVVISAEGLPPWAGALLTALALKPLLAWRMLRVEVLAVDDALGESLAQGRKQLARLVSRDVRTLSAGEVRESAIESLAENLNDSLVAPIFWFVLLGLPGAALYRFANTADAMWGYRGERGGRVWDWAGKWAARADDVLSWVPARITALLLWCCASTVRGHARWSAIAAEARKTPSPNSGWPMATMALLLGVRLGKPGVYMLNAKGQPPVRDDLVRAVRLAGAVVVATALCAAGSAALAGICLGS